ncbi:MAG: 30S ribosomal protein S2 [Candidatus Niyogibacteria bacterium]|nr:30S ribosomal protein S2 [Candidatus Niyogibacteria bacterium]
MILFMVVTDQENQNKNENNNLAVIQSEEKSDLTAKGQETAVLAESAIPERFDQELEKMFKAGVHFGYSRSRRHPKMTPYIFGLRNNAEVFDLEKIKVKLKEASAFIRELGKEKKTVVLVGTKPAIRDIVEKAAREAGLPYVNERWLGGFITNFPVIRKRMDYYENLKNEKESGGLEKYTKKERLEIAKELAVLGRNFDSLLALKKLPDALLIVDPENEKTAAKEAADKKIPVVAILNSDSNPENISYPIPANDASRASVDYLLSKITEAYQEITDAPKT